MSKNYFNKNEMKVSVLKLKHDLYLEHITHDTDAKELANKYLNKVLDILDQYRT